MLWLVQALWCPHHALPLPPLQVIAEIQGELVGGRFIRDFSTKYLGVPNILHWPADNPYPEQYTVYA